MSLDRTTIGTGINISFIESDKFKTNHIGVSLISGLNKEKASKNALLTKVLKRGSKNYPTMAILNRELDFLYSAGVGAGVYKIGEAQIVGLSAYMLENKYALDDCDILMGTVDILGDILTNPLIEDGGFKTEYVEGEKTNLINDIEAQINDKGSYSYRKCTEIMCKDEKFSINNLGTIDDVKAIDSKNLYEHYKYAMASYTMEIFCVGKFVNKKQMLIDKFKNLFKDIKRGNLEPFDTQVILKAENKGEHIEEMQVNQGKLAMGFRIGMSNKDIDFAKFTLFNSIYGSSPTSKLFENVRERLSLCYYCHTAVEAEKGIVTVLSGIEVENKQKTIDEVLKQLDEMKNNNFTDKEMEDARLSIINSYKGVFDSSGSIEFWYLRRLLCGVIRTPEEAIELIKKVSREDVIEAANRLTLDTVYFLKGTNLASEEDADYTDNTEEE